MKTIPESRVILEIDLNKLRRNFASIKQAVAPCSVIAVLKANAYGLGVMSVAAALKSAGAAGFGVAELNEAEELAALGLPVQILGNILPGEIPQAVASNTIIPVNDIETARAVSNEADRQGKNVNCQFLIDTGMGRLGILCDEAAETIRGIKKLPHLNCNGIYSHFPVAYLSGNDYTMLQVEKFKKLLDELAADGIHFDHVHIANSDAINNFPATNASPFNQVRTGINMYGLFDEQGKRSLALDCVITLKTRLAAIRRLPAGTSIGYGRTCRLVKDTVVGTIAAGYADGLPLGLSNRGYVLLRDQLCPVLGKVSMDYTTISLENVPEAQCGDEVICLGGSDTTGISADHWAQLKGTNPYEILCSFGTRVERKYVDY